MAKTRVKAFVQAGWMACLTIFVACKSDGAGSRNSEHRSVSAVEEKSLVAEEKPVPAPKLDIPEEMVLIPGAEIRFDRAGDADAKPTELVRIDPFLIDRLEATVAEYLACRESGACTSPIDRTPQCNVSRARQDHPINCISWHEAQRYCASKNKRLPSSAEWELAARGTDQRHYPWGNAGPAEQLCWQGRKKKTRDTTCPVGSFAEGSSPYGVLDMAGNVAEWTSTIVDGVYPQPAYDTRGGGYFWEQLDSLSPDDTSVRADSSGGLAAGATDPLVGVRCARSVPSRVTEAPLEPSGGR